MNRIGKTVFVVTALTPILWGCALSQFRHGDTSNAWWYLIISFTFVVVCFLLIFLLHRNGEREKLFTKKVKPADKEILAFLFAYLLPLFSKESVGFTGDIVVAVYVIVLIAITVYHSNSYTFNPLLSLFFRYHFYEVEGPNGMTYLLLTNKAILGSINEITVVKVYDYIYLDVE